MAAGSGGVCPPSELAFGREYYSVVNDVCTRTSSFFGGNPALGQAVGYAVVLGFGAFFTIFTSFLSIEALGMFLLACATGDCARGLQDTFRRSLDTIHRKMAHVAEVMVRFGDKVICPKDPTYSTVSPKVAKWSPFFDGCIGAIDGTHIEIVTDKESKEDMLNRKGFPSFNVLAIVDHAMRFTFVGSGMSGACHDMYVLRECQTRPRFPKPPPGMYYAADSGYQLAPGYLTPYKNTRYHLKQFVEVGPSTWEEKYNHDHASIRNVVERTFGVAKNRWQILDGVPFYKRETQSNIIVACCALHNYLVERKAAKKPEEQGSPVNRGFVEWLAEMPVHEMRDWIKTGVALIDPKAVLQVWVEKRYVGSQHTSEWFNTAGRSVKTGLIACVIVSQWTWVGSIMQSSNVAWQYGVSGPFWHASGATIQVVLFGVIAIEVKRKAPNAHAVCEIVRARWGTVAHVVFLVFCLATNIIASSMLPLGGSAVANALTGINVYAASFLIPLGVVAYTLAGGLKATFLASYIHSVILHVVLVIFVFLVYISSPRLGSPGVVYNHLMAAGSSTRDCSIPLSHPDQACGPVQGNFKGSYLTMLSSGGLIYGVINIAGGFGTIFADNGYLLGGLLFFALPFSIATALGLAALSLDLPLTTVEAAKGLVPAATATVLMGKPGAVLLLTMVFMTVTSAGSAELVAVSSLFTYDIYRTYINPDASGRQILRVSRAVVLGFGCFMGVLAIVLNLAGLSLGWVYLAMGVIIGSTVIPLALLLLWSDANALGAMLGAVVGCAAGITVWLTVAKVQYGRVNLDTTGRNAPMLAGNLVSILVGGAVHVACSLVSPQHFNWEATRQLITTVESVSVAGDDDDDDGELDEGRLLRAKRWIVRRGVACTAVIVVLWPALSLPLGRFSAGYFTLWAAVAIAWGTVGSAVIIFLPLVESWGTICKVCVAMFTGHAVTDDKTHSKQQAQLDLQSSGHGDTNCQ
ncbi:hypothetical protein EJB05_02732, partial [Eragrostis curvula]